MTSERPPLIRAEIVLEHSKPLLLDAVAPIVIYYGLRAVGVGDLLALLAGAAVPLCDAVVGFVRTRRLQPLPIYVCVMFALTAALAVFVHDPRVVMLKASVTLVALGVYFLGTTPGRPAVYTLAGPAVARGSDERAARWREAWTDGDFRWRFRLATALLGVLFLFDALLRTVIIYRLPIGESVVFEHAPAPITILAILAIGRFLLTPAVHRAMQGAT